MYSHLENRFTEGTPLPNDVLQVLGAHVKEHMHEAARGATDRAGIIDLDKSAALVQQLAHRSATENPDRRSGGKLARNGRVQVGPDLELVGNGSRSDADKFTPYDWSLADKLGTEISLTNSAFGDDPIRGQFFSR